MKDQMSGPGGVPAVCPGPYLAGLSGYAPPGIAGMRSCGHGIQTQTPG